MLLQRRFFIYFHYKSMVDNDMPGAWPVWTPGAPLAAFIKESIIHWSTLVLVVESWIKSVQPGMTKNCHFLLLPLHWSTQHMKALGHMVSEKKIFLCFSHYAPGAGPVWTPGARLAGFIKRNTIHCYKQNMKALGLVVSEKKIFFYVFP